MGLLDLILRRRGPVVPSPIAEPEPEEKAARPIEKFPVTGDEEGQQAYPRVYYPGSRVDWRRDAGRLDQNGLVSIIVGFYQTNWHQARVMVGRMKGKEFEEIPNHPLAMQIENPNPWYSGETLWDGSIVSALTSGNCYWGIARNGFGDPCFVYLPHHRMKVFGGKGTTFVSRYEYDLPGSGVPLPLRPDEVLHFRRGVTLDDIKLGLSPLAALIREVATDNHGSNYDASLLKNYGATALILAAKEGISKPSPDQAEEMARAFRATFSGDGAGKAAFFTVPMEKVAESLSPEAMALNVLRSIPMMRLLAGAGLSAMALDLPSDSKTYSNYGESVKAAWTNGLLPHMDRFARTLTRFARSWYGDETLVVKFDTSAIDALQPDVNALWDRVGKAYQAGFIKRKTALRLVGEEFDEKDDDVYKTEADMGVRGKAKEVAKIAAEKSRERRRILETVEGE